MGPGSAVPREAIVPSTQMIDARGGFVGPGFVDPHTHLVFAGERSTEFELRCRGATYLDIARAGGGIHSTVRATRAASEDELVELASRRLSTLLAQGITTAEVKSGYGLSLDQEIKMLRVIRRLSTAQPVELIPTLLCAHAIPEEGPSRSRYIDICVREMPESRRSRRPTSAQYWPPPPASFCGNSALPPGGDCSRRASTSPWRPTSTLARQ